MAPRPTRRGNKTPVSLYQLMPEIQAAGTLLEALATDRKGADVHDKG